MSDWEKRTKGQMAAVLSEHMKPYLDAQRLTIIQTMMVEYRQGKLDYHALLARVAGLCVLEDIENNLKQDINRGERATKELSNGNIN